MTLRAITEFFIKDAALAWLEALGGQVVLAERLRRAFAGRQFVGRMV